MTAVIRPDDVGALLADLQREWDLLTRGAPPASSAAIVDRLRATARECPDADLAHAAADLAEAVAVAAPGRSVEAWREADIARRVFFMRLRMWTEESRADLTRRALAAGMADPFGEVGA